MASKGIEMGLVIFVLMTVQWTVGVTAQTSGCTSVIIGMAPCLNYITGNSSSPSSSCCLQLSNVLQNRPQCLCSVLNGGSTAVLGFAINQTLALALPGACNLQTPPLSRCNAAGPATSPTTSTSPLDSPADSPTDSSTETPDIPITPMASDTPTGRTGSKSTSGDTSDGNITRLPLHLIVFLLFIASYASSSLTTSF